jgi:hypothetical protein
MPENVPSPIRTDSDPADPPQTVPARVPGTYCVCEFCECKLTRSGEVYSMSEKARAYRDAGETHRKEIAKLTEQSEDLQRRLAAKETELAALRGNSARGKTAADALL